MFSISTCLQGAEKVPGLGPKCGNEAAAFTAPKLAACGLVSALTEPRTGPRVQTAVSGPQALREGARWPPGPLGLTLCLRGSLCSAPPARAPRGGGAATGSCGNCSQVSAASGLESRGFRRWGRGLDPTAFFIFVETEAGGGM